MGLIQLSKEHIQQAAKTLATSFFDYPFWCYIFPNENKRFENLYATYEMIVRHGLRYGEVYATSINFEGVCILIYSMNMKTSLMSYILSGALKCIKKIGLACTKKLLVANDYMTELHDKHISEPHWHLAFMGVYPEHQRKGFGTFLLNSILQNPENYNLPCYIETHNEDNLNYFQRFGFKVVEKGFIPKSNVANWCMIRK